MSPLECDVLIAGCGPTGVVLASLLGQLGVRTIVLEREPDVFPVPRATHIDEETVRNFQATGLIDALLPHTELFGTIEVVDEKGHVLLQDEVGDPESIHGYRGSRFFDQPAFERVLREGLGRFACVRLITGTAVESVANGDDRALVRARSGTGDLREIAATWVVGCDGGRSAVRSSAGIVMESIAEKRPWLIVDSLLRDPSDAARLPQCFRYVLNPDRLTVYAHGFGNNRRWEFQLPVGGEAPPDDVVFQWIAPFIDPARLEVTRVATYQHTALVARQWRVGRVLIAGDAAHMMPPSAGQGMCSGIRDAVNLAWKLAFVVRGTAPDLLDTYERERDPHVREILDGTLFIGRRLRGDTVFQRWLRHSQLRVFASMPRVRARARRRMLRRPVPGDGCRDALSPLAGKQIPQCEVTVEGQARLLDDVLGYRFAVVARAGAADDSIRAWAGERGIGVVEIGREISQADPLQDWMAREGVDVALVRPDRAIFAAGRAADVARAIAAYDRWFTNVAGTS